MEWELIDWCCLLLVLGELDLDGFNARLSLAWSLRLWVHSATPYFGISFFLFFFSVVFSLEKKKVCDYYLLPVDNSQLSW